MIDRAVRPRVAVRLVLVAATTRPGRTIAVTATATVTTTVTAVTPATALAVPIGMHRPHPLRLLGL